MQSVVSSDWCRLIMLIMMGGIGLGLAVFGVLIVEIEHAIRRIALMSFGLALFALAVGFA